MTDFIDRSDQRLRQCSRTATITLQQMKSHALRRFGADPGQAF
jgi:hypothetical protein